MNAVILAHGIGGRSDLPVPLWMALYGAGAAVVVSFAVLGAFWRNPKLEDTGAGRPLPLGLQRLVEAPATTAILRAAGLLAALAVLLVAAVGPAPATSNFAPTWVYVWFWVGLVPASLLLGPVWKALNPLRALSWIEARMTGVKEEPERSLPAWLGYWPAAGGLAAFAWLELVYQDAAKPVTVLIFLLLYGLVQLIGASYFGMRWYERCDGFEVYSTLVGRLCPFGRRDDGRLVVRNPLRGLAGLEPGPGLVAVVAVLLGSTGFDGLSRTTAWTDLTQDASVISALLIGTAGLASAIAFVALTFYVAIASSQICALGGRPIGSRAPGTFRSLARAHRDRIHRRSLLLAVRVPGTGRVHPRLRSSRRGPEPVRDRRLGHQLHGGVNICHCSRTGWSHRHRARRRSRVCARSRSRSLLRPKQDQGPVLAAGGHGRLQRRRNRPFGGNMST